MRKYGLLVISFEDETESFCACYVTKLLYSGEYLLPMKRINGTF